MTTIDAIKARCEAATPGPWRHIPNTNNGRSLFSVAYEPRLTKIGEMYTSRDADFIAHSREDIPYLLERIAEMEGQLVGAGANQLIQAHIIESQRNPLDADKIVRLTMENASLRAQLTTSQQRERAMLSDMAHEMECGACCHVRVDVCDEPCASCRRENSKFKWRGHQEANRGEI